MNYRLAYGGYVRRVRHTSAVTRIIILYLVSAIGVSDCDADLGDVSSLSLTFRRFLSSKEPPRAIYNLGEAYSLEMGRRSCFLHLGALIVPNRF